jgi:hypothetical protein
MNTGTQTGLGSWTRGTYDDLTVKKPRSSNQNANRAPAQKMPNLPQGVCVIRAQTALSWTLRMPCDTQRHLRARFLGSPEIAPFLKQIGLAAVPKTEPLPIEITLALALKLATDAAEPPAKAKPPPESDPMASDADKLKWRLSLLSEQEFNDYLRGLGLPSDEALQLRATSLTR